MTSTQFSDVWLDSLLMVSLRRCCCVNDERFASQRINLYGGSRGQVNLEEHWFNTCCRKKTFVVTCTINERKTTLTSSQPFVNPMAANFLRGVH